MKPEASAFRRDNKSHHFVLFIRNYLDCCPCVRIDSF